MPGHIKMRNRISGEDMRFRGDTVRSRELLGCISIIFIEQSLLTTGKQRGEKGIFPKIIEKFSKPITEFFK